MTAPGSRPYDVLLLDFGGVCLVNPVELHRRVEDRLGLEAGTLRWTGPIAPEHDELYRRSLAVDGLTERDYWAQRAAEVGRHAGVDLDTRGYMRVAYDAPEEALVRPEAVAVTRAAQAAGIGVSVLTNDLRAFHDQGWVDRISYLRVVDHVFDCSHVGFLKPAPEAYRWALSELGVAAERILFVDDQPLNVSGAEAVGMGGLWFDIRHAGASWDAVGAHLGLPLSSG